MALRYNSKGLNDKKTLNTCYASSLQRNVITCDYLNRTTCPPLGVTSNDFDLIHKIDYKWPHSTVGQLYPLVSSVEPKSPDMESQQ